MAGTASPPRCGRCAPAGRRSSSTAASQEGVEPPLNGVFFAAPRTARDIIQCICRALNAAPPPSRVFLPVTVNPGLPPEACLARFATIVPYAEALLSEDPAYMITSSIYR